MVLNCLTIFNLSYTCVLIHTSIMFSNFSLSELNNNNSSILNSHIYNIDLEEGLLQEELQTYYLNSRSILKVRFENFIFRIKTKVMNIINISKYCIIEMIARFLTIMDYLDKLNKEYLIPIISRLEKIIGLLPTNTTLNLIQSMINKIKDFQLNFYLLLDVIEHLKELFTIHPIVGII